MPKPESSGMPLSGTWVRHMGAFAAPELRYNGGMRRFLYIATLSLILLALPGCAQRRGGGAHVASRGGSVGHTSVGHSSGAFHGGSLGHSSGIHVRTGNRSYNRRGFYGRRNYSPYVGYYPYGYYGWYDDPLAYDTADQDQDSYAGTSYPAPNPESSPQNGELQRDVQALNGKIDRLQEDVE